MQSLFASTAEVQKEDAQMHFSDFTYVTRGQLAEELHVTKGTIRQWET
jgi:DNA-binding transcriptional regulator YiaG